ncbi:MAG: hypothetical protein ACRD9S_04600 [Pyrinomonadaceae bacterium]
MRKGFLGINILSVLVLLFVSSPSFMAQRRPNRPAPPPATPARNDLKITYRTTTSGQPTETTTMLKGVRERSEMKLGYGMDMINVTQCDLKRTIQISDSAKKYVITPMESGDATPNAPVSGGGMSEPSRRGGVVTYTSNAVDTGERKEMFGFQARHVKTSMIVDSSPDACNPVKQRMETDGWYIDFAFGLNCDLGARPPMVGRPSPRGGCRDAVRFNRQGAARTGYALQETVTSYGPDGRVAFTSSKEVVELSREPLDAALFDIPAGYVEAASAQELYAMPSMAAMSQMSESQQPSAHNQSIPSNTSNAKPSGSIRVGVVQINNKTDRSVSQESLRQRLIGEIQGDGIDAVPLNAISPREAEAEAKAKQCDFILYTDLTTLKASAAKKLGGFLGRATGVGSGVDKTEAKVEFQLFAVGETTARLKSAANAKEEGDEGSAGTALDLEGKQVSAAVRKRN